MDAGPGGEGDEGGGGGRVRRGGLRPSVAEYVSARWATGLVGPPEPLSVATTTPSAAAAPTTAPAAAVASGRARNPRRLMRGANGRRGRHRRRAT